MNLRRATGIMRHFFWRIPKGFRNKATLGSCVRSMTTLKGLWPTATAAQPSHNPVGVVKHRPHLPRVARPSQPWALLQNPFGILCPAQFQLTGEREELV